MHGGNDDLWGRYLRRLERSSRQVLIVSAVVCVLSAASIVRLQFDVDPLAMLPGGTPEFTQYRNYLAQFGAQSALVVLIDAPDETTAVAFGEVYAQRLAALPSIAHVRYRFDPMAFHQEVLARYLPAYLPREGLDAVRARLAPAAIRERVQTFRQALALPAMPGLPAYFQQDPLGLEAIALEELGRNNADLEMRDASGFFLSEDRRALLILAQPRAEVFAVPFARRLLADCRAIAEEIQAERPQWRAVRVAFTGGHAHVLSDTLVISRDMLIYTTVAPLVILAAFHLAYRNLAILPLVTYPLLCGLLVTFAASQLLYEGLDLISLSTTAIFYGLAIDSGIHFYTRLLQEGAGRTPLDAMCRTLRVLGPTHLVASTTTAVVFLVLGLSRIRGVSQLGSLTAMAMLANIGAMFIVFPALFFAISRRVSIIARPPGSLDTPRLGRLTGWCGERRGLLAAVVVAFGVGVVVIGGGIRLDTDFRRLRPPDTEPARTEDEIDARFGTGAFDGAIVTEGATMETALQKAERVAVLLRRYTDDGRLAAVRTPVSLVPSVRTQERRWRAWRKLPRRHAANALRAALREAGFRVEAFTSVLQLLEQDDPAFIMLDDMDAALPAALAPVASLYLRHGADRAYAVTLLQPGVQIPLEALAPMLRADLDGHGAVGWLSGRRLMEAGLAGVLRRELWLFTLFGFLANIIIVWLAVRRVRLTIAVMLPPALVLILFLAGIHLADLALTPITVVVLPLALGISVDDCVYLAERHRAGATLAQVGTLGGRAVVMSTVTTVIGFGFLAFSHSPGLAQLGLFTAVAIALALVTACTVLPACLSWSGPGR